MMIAMSNWIDFLSGNFISGLVGAGIGGGASIWGARMQAKASDKTARNTAARAAAQEAYDVLSEFESMMAARPPARSFEEKTAWNRDQRAMIIRARAGVGLLPASENARRTRCREDLALITPFNDHIPWADHVYVTTLIVEDVMRNLGTYVTQRPVPVHDDLKHQIEDERKKRRSIALGRKLMAFEEAAERYGLTASEINEANEIKAELGVEHSRELTTEERTAITS